MTHSMTTRQVAALTGASFRQLDYWDRTGVLCPSVAPAKGSGSSRRYSPDDVRCALALVLLARLGAEGDYLRRAVTALRDAPADWDARQLYLVLGPTQARVVAQPWAALGTAAYVVDLHQLLVLAVLERDLQAVQVA